MASDQEKNKFMNELIRAKAGRGRIKHINTFMDGFNLGAHIREYFSKDKGLDGSITDEEMNELIRGGRGDVESEVKNERE